MVLTSITTNCYGATEVRKIPGCQSVPEKNNIFIASSYKVSTNRIYTHKYLLIVIIIALKVICSFFLIIPINRKLKMYTMIIISIFLLNDLRKADLNKL